MSKNVAYAVETLDECLTEMKPLLKKQWEEMALNKDKVAFNPDYELYYQLEGLGTLHTVTARKRGVLVGYYLSFVNSHPHHKNHLFASNDFVFVDADHRTGRTGVGLFQFAEKRLAELGVSVVLINTKTHAPFDRLCEYLGYSHEERLYSKYIGE